MFKHMSIEEYVEYMGGEGPSAQDIRDRFIAYPATSILTLIGKRIDNGDPNMLTIEAIKVTRPNDLIGMNVTQKCKMEI